MGSLVVGLVGAAVGYWWSAPYFTGPDRDAVLIYVVDGGTCGLFLGALIAGGLAYLYRHSRGTRGPHQCWSCGHEWSP
jgi:hypothetical protein